MRTVTLVVVALAVLLVAGVPSALARSSRDDVVPGSYIVTYKSSVTSPGGETATRERSGKFDVRFVYRHALRGFAARLDAAQVRRLEADPEVASVTPDRVVHATAETFPSGVQRIRASVAGSANPPSATNVAVIDTGVSPGNSDLNAVSAINCVNPAASADDDAGHGTHVAGIIGARADNGSGVVGVVPGTRIYGVKVLDSFGSGTWAQVVCGLDWVAANAASQNIGVANLSLGGAGTQLDFGACGSTTSLHQAICNAAAKVAVVVAAGNDAWDFDNQSVPDVPAVYPEVVTVTAVSDSDGQPGGTGGPPACLPDQGDDRFASFSNWAGTPGGQAHTLAAPGVCILSDWLGGGTDTISGTSMAAPHVAGAIAHCNGNLGGPPGPCAGRTNPADLIPAVTTADPAYHYVGDPSQPVAGQWFGAMAIAGGP
jgi:subtilisin family serine protease